MAEGALRLRAAKAGVPMLIDSAGTGNWHVGDAPDPRAVAAARAHGADIGSLRARQVAVSDFRRFSHIFAMDGDNLAALQRMVPAGGTRPRLLLDLVPGHEGQPVPDPYWSDAAAFRDLWSLLDRAALAILAEQLTAGHGPGQSAG